MTVKNIWADMAYDDNNYGECINCEEDHVLCPFCECCLKYCCECVFLEIEDEKEQEEE